MAKTTPNYSSLKAKARDLYLKGTQQKEIAELLNITAVTVTGWVSRGGWKAERDARINSSETRTENIRSIIGYLSGQQVELLKKIATAEASGDIETAKDLRAQADGVADKVSKWNKTLNDMIKETRITLSVYLDVMDSIFRHMKGYDLELFHKTLDFQELHVHEMSKRLG
jgi:uncharacterized protein YjcR